MANPLPEPLTLDALTLESRILVAPTCQDSARDGEATGRHMMLGRLTMSGAGLLTLDATADSPEVRIIARDLGLNNDGRERALGRSDSGLNPDRPCRLRGPGP
ncbi:hypothetical protein [Methylobacterium sp. NMS14P]|uniref:hypothetical protein n=1 Tax=Methylobacterium sp. NMS14P TaxID=2894310 RepID=UPI003FD13EEC